MLPLGMALEPYEQIERVRNGYCAKPVHVGPLSAHVEYLSGAGYPSKVRDSAKAHRAKGRVVGGRDPEARAVKAGTLRG